MHGFLSYALNNPKATLDQVLRGIFTAPQAKKVRQAIGVKPETPVAMLHARQWAIVCDAMVRHVPKMYWPRRKKVGEHVKTNEKFVRTYRSVTTGICYNKINKRARNREKALKREAATSLFHSLMSCCCSVVRLFDQSLLGRILCHGFG